MAEGVFSLRILAQLEFTKNPGLWFPVRIVKQKWFEKISSPHIIRICLGVLRTLGFYINFRQLAINGHKYCVLAHAFSPQRAEARLGEEMFINGYALKTR